MKRPLGKLQKCEKCGKLLAPVSSKKFGKRANVIHGYYGVRIEIGEGKELIWAVCQCGHETPVGRPKDWAK